MVNGREAARVAVDPEDPYLSAARLRYLEITPWTREGENTVTVRYNGNLEASIILESKEWGYRSKIEEAETAPTHIERSLQAEARFGRPVPVRLRLKAPQLLPAVTIVEESSCQCGSRYFKPR